MEFFESYKRLAKICGEMFHEPQTGGVTAYINEMERTAKNGWVFVEGWNKDLSTLKRLRHIRNNIAHTPGYSEENSVSPEDVKWLDDFYDRIISNSDPLSIYQSKMRQIAEKKQRAKQRLREERKKQATFGASYGEFSARTPMSDAEAEERAKIFRKLQEEKRNEIISARIKAVFVLLFAAIAVAALSLLFIYVK